MDESMRDRRSTPAIDQIDYLIASLVGMAGLFLYVRTLAPDVLYADSAEFQTLTYTLGTTHSTGYPIYLLLARLVGFLPFGTLAWRVNLFSAICAAGTLGGIYLMGRSFTENRVGPALGSLSLGISYTFWSQAIIAEVYTPGMLFLVVSTILLWHWKGDPERRNLFLFFASFLSGLGLGVHASAGLIAPAAAVVVLWTVGDRRMSTRWRKKSSLTAIAGAVLGVTSAVFAFLLIDLHNPTSSFIRATLSPSRSIWDLTSADLDSPFKHLYLTVTGLQWRDAMFSTYSTGQQFRLYLGQAVCREFTPLLIVLALFGMLIMWHYSRQLSVYCIIAYLTSLYLVLNYDPPDRSVFYLSTYIWLSTALGVGAGSLLELARLRYPDSRSAPALAFSLLPFMILFLAVLIPSWRSRWQALREGKASFVEEEYAYPVNDLDEPRGMADLLLSSLPEDAIVIMDWRYLYSTYYIAHVEQRRTGITLVEALPHGNRGKIADTLVQELEAAIKEGRPAYSVGDVPGLREDFRVMPAPGNSLFRLSLP